jgi:hypothetical protein
MTKYEPHPAAMHFPLLEGKDYEQLRENIRNHGLYVPLTIYEGKILDGRNRQRACTELGIEPRIETYEGDDPVAFAWAVNGERRHLAHGQKAAIAVEMLPALEEEARKRQLDPLKRGDKFPVPPPVGERNKKGEAVDQAAAIVGISGTSVQQTKAVKERDPKMFEKIKKGEIAVSRAYKQTKDKPRLDGRSIRKSNSQRVDEIKQLVAEGHRTQQIADRLGIHSERVREIAREASIKLADAAIAKSHRIKAARVIEQTVTTIEGCALGLQAIGFNFSDVTAAQAKQWAESLTQPLKALASLRKKLLEISA